MKRALYILALALLAFAAAPILAQEGEASAEDPLQVVLYSNAELRYNVVVPPGWTDNSTPNYALLTRDGTQIFVRGSAPLAPQQAVAEALAVVAPDLDAGTPELREDILPNGTWARLLYPLTADGTAVTAYIQSDDNTTFVVGLISPAGARPLVAPIPDATVPTAVRDAAVVAVEQIAPGAVLTAEATETAIIFRQTLTRYEFETADGEPLSVWSRMFGTSGYALVAPPDAADPEVAVFISVLLDFFITPETTDYLFLGLAVTAGILLLAIISLIIRSRSLRQDIQMLEGLTADKA
jgi:hypothetical protein